MRCHVQKVAVGQFMQESHSFTPIACSWEQFRAGHIHRGEDILTRLTGNKVEVAGAIDLATRQETSIVPLLACNAVSSGTIRSDVFADLLGELLERLESQLPVDGVFLALHGAMVAEDEEDATGAVIAQARALVGEDIPIVASLDLHANVTNKMIAASDGLIGYQTCPHVDLFETGAASMQLLLDIIHGKVKPTMAHCQLPMIAPADKSVTLDGPFRELMQYALEFESHPDVLSVSVFYVQPWLDLRDVGCSVVVITNSDQQLAAEIRCAASSGWFRLWHRRSASSRESTGCPPRNQPGPDRPTPVHGCYALKRIQPLQLQLRTPVEFMLLTKFRGSVLPGFLQQRFGLFLIGRAQEVALHDLGPVVTVLCGHSAVGVAEQANGQGSHVKEIGEYRTGFGTGHHRDKAAEVFCHRSKVLRGGYPHQVVNSEFEVVPFSGRRWYAILPGRAGAASPYRSSNDSRITATASGFIFCHAVIRPKASVTGLTGDNRGMINVIVTPRKITIIHCTKRGNINSFNRVMNVVLSNVHLSRNV